MHGREWHILIKVFCIGLFLAGIFFWTLAVLTGIRVAWASAAVGTLSIICSLFGFIAGFKQTRKAAHDYFMTLLISTFLVSVFVSLNIILDLVMAPSLCYSSIFDCGYYLIAVGVGGLILALVSMIGCCGCIYFSSRYYREITEEDQFLAVPQDENEDSVIQDTAIN